MRGSRVAAVRISSRVRSLPGWLGRCAFAWTIYAVVTGLTEDLHATAAPCGMILAVDNGIVIVQDDEDTIVHCQRCGVSCQIPPDLPARAIHDFYRDHRPDVEVNSHSQECPAWALGLSSRRP